MLNILKNEKFELIEKDFYVVNKLVSFSYYVVNEFPISVFKKLFLDLLKIGFGFDQEEIFLLNFFDFALLLFYKYNINISEHHDKIMEFIT